MKNILINLIKTKMKYYLNESQISELNHALESVLNDFEVIKKDKNLTIDEAVNRINNGEDYIIRFRSMGSHDKKFKFKDLVKGELEIPENDLDIVIMKKDGLPTYHFAHLVDDYLMGTTHVVRGEEWLSSVPVHVELFRTLGVINFVKLCYDWLLQR